MDPRRTCRLHTERLRLGFGPGTFVTPHCPATSDVPFGLESMTLSSSQNYTPQRMKPEHMLEYRNMLVWGFLLVIHFPCIGATPEICKKEWPCADPVCFEMRRSSESACTSTSHTHLCSFNRSCIEYKCDAALTCQCEGSPVKLADLPKCPVKDEKSISMENEVHAEETKRYEDSSMTPLQIAFAVVGAVLAVLLVFGAITYYILKACRKQGHREPQLGGTDPQRQPQAQDQNEMELEDRNDASVERSSRSVETQGQDASDGAAGRGAEDADGEGECPLSSVKVLGHRRLIWKRGSESSPCSYQGRLQHPGSGRMERTRGERNEPAASDLEPFSLNIKYFGRYQRRDPPVLNPRLFPSKVQGFFIRIQGKISFSDRRCSILPVQWTSEQHKTAIQHKIQRKKIGESHLKSHENTSLGETYQRRKPPASNMEPFS